MVVIPLVDARNRLSECVAEVERTHERVTITRHGHPAAILISPDDLESLEETLDILGDSEAMSAISESMEDLRAGRFADNDAVKDTYLNP
jgi:prevent-host-death family protein